MKDSAEHVKLEGTVNTQEDTKGLSIAYGHFSTKTSPVHLSSAKF